VSVLEFAEWVAGNNNDPSRGAEVWMVDIIERREEAFLDSLFGPAHVLAASLGVARGTPPQRPA
jgi:hypothetical protein